MKRLCFLSFVFIWIATITISRCPIVLADEGRWLAQEQILLYGLGLNVEPAHQTVPKDIATIVSTYLQAPDSIPEGTLPIPEDAEVRATLRGPSLSQPVELVTRVNEHFEIQPFQLAGIHTLENIRVVHNDEVILYATPESVTIEVIDQLLITEVTARALTAEEIQEKGIIFDSSNFQAYNFTAAFAVEPGQDITIDFPVLLPILQSAQDVSASEAEIPSLKPPQLQSIATIIPDTLKVAQAQIPNLMVKGFSFDIVGELMGVLEAPTIPGVIVIPGDIGFLNQYFSVMLMVGNAAPEGSGLIVQDLQAELVLPAGNDTVVGSGDDPLAMAITQQGESPRTQPVAKPGPDQRLGTADDEDFIAPGQTGNAEFLVEGRREGTHVIEMEISGTLTGLPIGPVEIRGRAAGAVLVRNPSFTLTFTHPEIVNTGEAYDLDVTVTNTSGSPANFVSVNLYSRNISGASLEGTETQEVETIPPGDSAVASFRLRSHVTGTVFATTLDSDEKVAGRFELKTSVGELGIPLSPDSLVLPKEAGSLPESLRKASVALLGKAYAAATSPASAMPRDIKRFTKNMVWDRAVEVAQAGLRYTLHEPLGHTAAHLLMDFTGGNYAQLQEEYPEPDQTIDLEAAQNDFLGFDDLRRRSFRGDVFADEIAQILADDLASPGLSDFHTQLAETISFRPEHLSVLMGTDGASLPFRLVLVDDQGNTLGAYDDENEKIIKEIPYSDYLVFEDAGGNTTAQMALIASPKGTGYIIRLERDPDVAPGTPFSLSIVLPADTPSRLRQVVFSGITGDNGVPMIEQVAGDPFPITVEMYDTEELISGQPMQPTSTVIISDPPPSVISTVQMADADVLTCLTGGTVRIGRVVAALFSEAVTPESVQDQFEKIDISNYAPENNEVVGVALQPGGRIVYLALRDPVGPFIQRQMTILNATDLRGQEMATSWTGPIEPTIEDEPYGVVSGQILNADGAPVPYADVRLFTGFCGCYHGISTKTADAEGNYSWDFVFLGSKVVAVQQETGEFRSIPFRVQRHGQRLNLNIVFLGRGTLKGRAIAEDGFTLLPDTHIKVTSLTDYSEYGATTDDQGVFVIPDIPVGSILIEAVNIQYDHHTGQITSQSKLSVSEYIPETNALLERDLVLVSPETAQMTTQYGAVSGHVLESDGSTPIAGVPVVVYYRSNSQEGLQCQSGVGECPVAMTTTNEDGAFFFAEIPAGDLRIYTFEQSRLLEGEAWITLEANSEAQVNVLLSGGLGTVSGIVLDADGNPVAGATVGGGMSLAITDENGRFIMTDVPVGGRKIVAVSQGIGSDGFVVVNLMAEGDEVGATIVLDGVGSVTGTIYDTDGTTPVPNLDIYLWYEGAFRGIINVVATAVTDSEGHYRMDKVPVRNKVSMGADQDYTLSAFRPDFSAGDTRPVPVKFHGQTVSADITFRGSGRVTGTVFDDDGVTPLAARVSLSSLRVNRAGPVGVGFRHVKHVEIVENDLTTGEFAFNNVFLGNFVITAVGPFSPDPIAVSGIMPEDNATVNVTLQLQPTSEITGTVYDSDGATPVDQDVVVTFRGYKLVYYPGVGWVEEPQGIQEEIVTTDENGRFWLPVVNAGRYSITAHDLSNGKIGEINGMIRAGQTDDVSLRLLGLGDVTIRVFTSQGDPVPGAVVGAQQSGIQDVERTGTADAAGEITFTMPEGDFTVLARNLQNGFAGRAPGRVTEDGEQVIVNVYLWDATGTVSGTVFGPDGITPVPNAEVMIENLQGPLGIVISDDNGFYSMDTIPLGNFEVKVFEAATGRTGLEQGTILLAGQEVPVSIVLFPVGYVTGNVLSAEDQTPVEGYRVMIIQPDPLGRSNPLNCGFPTLTWYGTTGVDGGFAFPGIQLGTFKVIVGERGLGPIGCATTFGDGAQQTSVESRITYEGEQVDIPVLVDLTEPPEGRVMGWVYSPDGTPAANTLVGGIEATTTDAEGFFVHENVPVGRYALYAESQVTDDKGGAWAEVVYGGQTAYVRIILKGLGNVTGTVVDDTGVPAGDVRVKLKRLTRFADPQGAFSFENIPSGTFTVLAEDTVNGISGSTGGILLPGESLDVRVVLEPTESVTGVVLFSDQRLASGITLVMTGSDDTLYGETDADGRFTFDAVPVDTYTLTLDDPIGTGLATRQVSVVDSPVDLGDIVLDDTLPEVVSTDPIAGAVNVSLDQTVTVNFSKPIMPGTVTGDSIVLTRDDGETVTAILTVGNGDTSVTLTPLSPLSDKARYTLWISAAPPLEELDIDDTHDISLSEAVRYFPLLAKFDEYDTDGNGRLSDDEYPSGVEDRLCRVMQQEFACSFATVDITPPSISDMSPAASTGGVSVESVIRVSYSEPVNPNAFSGNAIELTVDQNPVEGRVDIILGNTAVVFTPDLPLAQDTVYQVEVLPATDLSGNVQTEGVTYEFSTTDSTPPIAQKLILSDGGTVIQGGVGTASADIGSAFDVSFADFYINGELMFTNRQAPFEMNLEALAAYGSAGDTINISVVLTDTSGNRGEAVASVFTIIADSPPDINISSVSTGTDAETGQRVEITVHAEDDLGLTTIAYQAVGGEHPAFGTVSIDPVSISSDQDFAFYVPVDAVPGSTIVVNATAVDTRGQSGEAVSAEITVLDATDPLVGFAGMSTGDQVTPGEEITAVVSAQDFGGIASITFQVSGASTVTETRDISPAQDSVASTFTFTVSPSATPPETVIMQATAVDQAGNSAQAPSVILPVADSVPPTIVSMATESGSSTMVPGETVTIIVEATDEVGLTSIEINGTGAFTYSDAEPIVPPAGEAQASFVINVPGSLFDGDTIDLEARAVDISGNISAPETLSLSVTSVPEVTLPASIILLAGDAQEVTLEISQPAPAGGLVVDLESEDTGIATVDTSLSLNEGETSGLFTVNGVSDGNTIVNASIQGFYRNGMTVAVQGGVVSGTVFDPSMAPVAGANVNVNGLTDETDSEGHFLIQNVVGFDGRYVRIQVADPDMDLQGYHFGAMNVPNGFLRDVEIILVEAGSVVGTAVLQDGHTPVGEGVRVALFRANDLDHVIDSVFTDADSRFEFPIVALGDYVLETSDTNGNHGRVEITLIKADEEVSTVVPFLGRGTVSGTVFDAYGVEVPNAQVKLWSASIFGSDTRTITAEQDGTFVFDDVFIGTFSVTAEDIATHMAAKEDGTIDYHEHTVNLTLQLGAWAALEGTVYRADGMTTVSGAQVSVGNVSTTTDVSGQYRFEVLPLGSHTVRATELTTRGIGRDTTVLDTLGETQLLDITFYPQGTLIVTVEDFNGVPVYGASVKVEDSAKNYLPFWEQRKWEITATTDSDGTTVINYVLEGLFKINAIFGYLTEETSGSIAADEILPVTVSLEPVGTIEGTVYEPDGVTPAQGIVEVTLLGGVQPQYVIADEDGKFIFEGIPLYDWDDNPKIYTLLAYEGGQLDPIGNYSGGQLRARVEDLVLETNGQVITQDLTLIGIGTVTGRVINPDSSSASGQQVTLESHTPVFGRTYSTITNAFGEYTFERVPVGDFTATSGDPDLQLLGETEGTIIDHLEEITADIVLQTNAITLPLNFYDGNVFMYNLQPDGTIGSGRYLFNYYARGGCSLDIISEGSTYTFPETGVATQENSGREIVVKETNLGGINVTRKIFVPEDAYFARYLEILSNTSSTDVTVNLRITSDFHDYYLSYYYPHETAAIVTTSSGDDQIQVGVESPDLWVTVDDNKPGDPFVDTSNNIPPSAFIWAGPDAETYPDAAVYLPYDTGTSSPANLALQWSSVTIPAGESVAFMHFVVPHANQEAAQACAERLVQIPPEALLGLSLAEIAMVKNFALPADGSSSLEPLPPLTGEVTGHVLAGDGVTSAGSTTVYFKSENIYFSRTYTDGTHSDGAFDFITNESTRRIPVEDFTLWARASVSSGSSYMVNPEVDSPIISETFLPGSTTNSLDIIFSNTGLLRGVIQKATGDPVEGAQVYAKSDSFWTYQYSTAADGSYVLPILLPDDYVVEVSTKSHPQGDPIETESATVIAAGQSLTLNISLPPLGAVSGIVYDHDGLPVEGALVRISDGEGFDRTTNSDSEGSYTLTELPVGDYTLWTYDPVSNVPTTASVSVAGGEITSVDVMLPYSVSLPTDLFDGNGFRWDIQTDGRIRYGTDNAYYYSSYGGLDLYRITMPDNSYDDFNVFADAMAENEGRELTIGPHVFSGNDLEVNRKIFVPDDEAFARYLEILENTGTSDMTVRIYIRTYLGSQEDTEIIQTSSGDQSLSVDDDYIITDDEDGTGTPTMVHVFSGPNAEVEPSEMESYLSSSYYRMGYYFDVTIPAGERRIVMHFASQNSNQADAHASATSLHCLQGRALAGLAPDEQMDIVNFVAYPDSDCDGLLDEEEDDLGTDPNNPDTDGDGLTDRFEVDYGFDPLSPGEETGDLDNDGLDNTGEQSAGTDPHNPDSDGDGISDGDEVNVYGTDPTTAVIRITDGAAPSDQADFAIDSLGNIHVVWVDDRHNDGDDNDEIYYTLLNSGGGTLIDDTRLTTDGDRSRRPAIAVDSQNRAHIAWQDKRLNNTPEIFYTAIDPSLHPQDGSPGDDTVMAVVDDFLLSVDDSDKGDTPRLTVDSQDRVHLVWSETDRGEIQYARLEVDEIAQSVNVTISRTIFSAGEYRWYPAHTDLALDSDENVHVVWLDHRDTSAVELFYEMLDSDTGATLIDETVLTVNDGDDAQYPSISIGPGDEITVAFSDYRLGTSEGFMMRINPALDAQEGSTAVASEIIVLPETPVTPDDGVASIVPTGNIDAQGNLHMTYFDPWDRSLWGDSYPADLHLLVTDPNGAAIEDMALTPDASAVTNGTAWTRARVAASGITSYVVWTDDRFGNAEVVLQIVSPDRDSDGLVDAAELQTGTNPDDADSDNDGLLDGFEVTNGFDPLVAGEQLQDPDGDALNNLQEQAAGTDPNLADTDADGLDDGDEISYGADPNRTDTDADGLSDGDEVHTWGSDPTLTDSDGDGLPDGFEVLYGFDPLVGGEQTEDPDIDGLNNLEEQSAGTNPTLADTDSDGLNDGDEVNTWLTDPLDPDSDDDDLLDGFEALYGFDPLATGEQSQDPDTDGLNNLEEQSTGTNPTLADSDGDNLLDGFEVLYGLDPLATGEQSQDPDTDGLDNLGEQNYGTDPGIPDSDGDLLYDGEEILTYGSTPTMWDTDDDQLGDGEEVQTYGTDPVNPDTDGGGRTDGQEVLYDGTDPVIPGDDEVPQFITDGSAASDQADMAIDSQANIHIVWTNGRNTSNAQIFYIMLSPTGQTLINDTQISSSASYDPQWPSIGIDSLDRVHVVWQDGQIVHECLDPYLDDRDGSAGDDTAMAVVDDHMISSVTYPSEHPLLAIDSQDRLHVVWSEPQGEVGYDIVYAKYDMSGGLEMAEQDIGSSEHVPAMDVDSQDNVHVVWTGYDQLVWSMIDGDDGTILIDDTQLTPGDESSSWYPSVDIGPNDEVTVVFEDRGTDGVNMMRIDPSLDSQDGDAADMQQITVLEPTLITSDSVLAEIIPSAILDSLGNVHVSYYSCESHWDYPPADLYYHAVDPSGAALSAERRLTDQPTVATTGYFTVPPVIAESHETVYVLWTDERRGQAEVMLLIINADPDHDGLSNPEEYLSDTNPEIPDSDGDGLLDGFEVTFGFDPLGPNESAGDPDADGLNNLAEQEAGTSPWLADTDGDGLTDLEEVDTDPSLADTDGDGLNDYEELITHSTDPNDPDMDDDGLLDGFEVFYGLDPFNTNESLADPDTDGLDNLAEQAAGTDPFKEDTDGDTLLDSFEIYYGFDPLADTGDQDEDPDNDGLINIEEQAASTDPFKADTDGGGRNDYNEVVADETNPDDPGDDTKIPNWGDLWVQDDASGTIMSVTPGGEVTIAIDRDEITSVTGTSTAGFNNTGLVFDASGNLYFTEDDSNTILKRSSSDGILTVLATEGEIAAAVVAGESLPDPEDLALGSDGMLYVIENETSSILRCNPDTGELSLFVEAQAFIDLDGITSVNLHGGLVANDDGTFYVVSYGSPCAIFEISTDGTPTVLVNGSGLGSPDDYAAIGPGGDLYVTEEDNNNILRITPEGVISIFLYESDITAITGSGSAEVEGGIAFDSLGNFYVAEDSTENILRFDTVPTGTIFVPADEMTALTGYVSNLEGGITFAP